MTGVQPMPCPVLLGTVKGGGLLALLHRYTIEKKVAKVENVLKKAFATSVRSAALLWPFIFISEHFLCFKA
uniref:Uncharacterized protein n=1 Tax=Sinocyclocheilus anshuiensis TaxID=1608454 RepID=A0A671LAE6_9TELE